MEGTMKITNVILRIREHEYDKLVSVSIEDIMQHNDEAEKVADNLRKIDDIKKEKLNHYYVARVTY